MLSHLEVALGLALEAVSEAPRGDGGKRGERDEKSGGERDRGPKESPAPALPERADRRDREAGSGKELRGDGEADHAECTRFSSEEKQEERRNQEEGGPSVVSIEVDVAKEQRQERNGARHRYLRLVAPSAASTRAPSTRVTAPQNAINSLKSR